MLLVLSQLTVFQIFAQEEKGTWLKKHADKNTKTENPEVDQASSDSLKILLDDYLKPEKEEQHSEIMADSVTPSTGQVTIITDYGIELLNDSLIQSPPPIPGYRIQVFFGSLDQAKSARANFIRNHSDIACNIEQITPSFSVRAGNFRNQQEAYKVLLALKPEYPGAIIVSDNIDLPELPE
jgi:hypothetical protein